MILIKQLMISVCVCVCVGGGVSVCVCVCICVYVWICVCMHVPLASWTSACNSVPHLFQDLHMALCHRLLRWNDFKDIVKQVPENIILMRPVESVWPDTMHAFELDICFLYVQNDASSSYLRIHNFPISSGLSHWISFSGFPPLAGCGTAVVLFWPKLKHWVFKHLQLNCFRVLHMQLTSQDSSSPGARVMTWWILILPGTAGISFGIFSIAFSTSWLFTKSSVTVVFVLVQLCCIWEFTALCHHHICCSFLGAEAHRHWVFANLQYEGCPADVKPQSGPPELGSCIYSCNFRKSQHVSEPLPPDVLFQLTAEGILLLDVKVMLFKSLYVAVVELHEVLLCALHRFLKRHLDSCPFSLFLFIHLLLFCYLSVSFRDCWIDNQKKGEDDKNGIWYFLVWIFCYKSSMNILQCIHQERLLHVDLVHCECLLLFLWWSYWHHHRFWHFRTLLTAHCPDLEDPGCGDCSGWSTWSGLCGGVHKFLSATLLSLLLL